MIEIGYKLSAEEFGAAELVSFAKRAEQAGFAFALISDHFHPWTATQGQSPFVWSVLGAIAQATERLRVGTAVTCPTMRTHPAIIAQAAATTASLMPGRFVLGLGTGENLNEHILGRGWPSGDVRLEMLEEAIEVIQLLWQGGVRSHRGRHFTVEDAQIFSLPEELPELMIAASKRGAAELAGRAGDAMINTDSDPKLVKQFHSAGGKGKPCFLEVGACWADDERQARETAHRIWPLAALGGPLFTELAQPSHFEAAFKPITEQQVAETVLCGPDPDAHVEKIRESERAGYTHVCVHQIGPDQEGFFRFYEREVMPKLGRHGGRNTLRPRPSAARADRKRANEGQARRAAGRATR